MRQFLLLLVLCLPMGLFAQQTYFSVPSGSAVVVSGGTTLRTGTVRIRPGATFKQSATAQSWLVLSGDLRNSGTYSKGLGSVRLVGNTAQRIDGPTRFYRLHLNNADGAFLSAASSVANRCQLEAGSITLDADLTLYTGAGLFGPFSPTRQFIADGAGRLVRGIAAPGLLAFPVGDATGTTDFTPILLNFTSGSFGAAAQVSVNLRNAKQPNNTSVTDYLNRYWTVTSSDLTGFVCNLAATYRPTDVSGSEANMIAASYSSGLGTWTPFGPLDIPSGLVVATTTSFSDFTAGEPSSLPVSLLYFNCKRAPLGVQLNWTTVSELNNDYFDVERALSPTAFALSKTVVGRVPGAGTTDAVKDYSLLDTDAPSDVLLYYRLRQVDTDGAVQYSPTIEVGPLDDTQAALWLVYPNPTTGHVDITLLNGAVDPQAKIQVRLTSLSGLAQLSTTSEFSSLSSLVSEALSRLPEGIYLLDITTSGGAKNTFRIVKQ